jgi:O-antigen/teichoic acid export membrane protein
MKSPLDLLRNEWKLLARVMRLRPFETETADGRSRERYRRIMLTSVTGLGVKAAGGVIGVVSVPLVLEYLGKERYGLWSAITTLTAWAALMDFGIANGLVNVISRAHGRDDPEDAARSLSSALALLVVVAATFGVVLVLTAGHIPWSSVFAVRGAVDEATVNLSMTAALGILLAGLPLSVVPQVYAGYQKTYLANLFALLGMLTGFAALLLALRSGASLPVLVVLVGVGALAGAFLALVYALRIAMPWLRLRASLVSTSALRGLMVRSFPIFLFQLGALTVNESQTLILAHRCGLSAVADYAVAMRIYILTFALIQVATQSFLPSFREALERKDDEWARRSFRRFVALRMGAAVAGAVVMVLLGNRILLVWLRRSDVNFSPELWAAMAVLLVASVWVGLNAELLTILDRLWIQVALVAGNAVCTVALTWWLAPWLGVLGVILAAGAVTVLCFSWLMPALARPLLRASS